MRIIFVILLIFISTSAYAHELVSTAPSLTSHAILAKQIIPGTSKAISFSLINGGCDSCFKDIKDKINGWSNRFDINLFNIIWPKIQQLDGAENWKGNLWGGGFFINAHYGLLLNAGISPIVIQWIGPFYIGATYELTISHNFGEDADNRFESSISTTKTTGTFNMGAGTIKFMNNHGLGFGIHGGLRNLHVISAGREAYTSYDSYAGKKINPKFREGYHVNDWVFYYGIDFTNYTNLPLLKESNRTKHWGYLISLEFGIPTKTHSFYFGNFSFSILL